jgi:hypothetical protein
MGRLMGCFAAVKSQYCAGKSDSSDPVRADRQSLTSVMMIGKDLSGFSICNGGKIRVRFHEVV